MTLREAADQLGITPDSLRQAIARGTLKASKRGRDWWVTERDLVKYRAGETRVRRPAMCDYTRTCDRPVHHRAHGLRYCDYHWPLAQ